MKTLGVIGGLGPLASAYFMELLVAVTDAKTDQEHLDAILMSLPSIPDRTAFILKKSDQSPKPGMIRAAQALASLGVSCLCAPCITSHYFYEEISHSVCIPFLNMLSITGEALMRDGVQSVGLLATTGTVKTGIFQRELSQRGISLLLPDQTGQEDVMHLIYHNLKAGEPLEQERFERVTASLKDQGAQRIILGCTELSLVQREMRLDECFVDPLTLLAVAAVQACEKPLKAKYLGQNKEDV